MPAAEIADYVSFRRAQRDLSGLAGVYPTISVDSQLSYFKRVERDIVALRTYSEISGMEESERVLKAAIAGKETRSWISGRRREKLADEIHYCLPTILRMSNLLSVTKMPLRDPAMKGRIVDLIRRLYDLKENMPEIPEGKYVNLNSTELFLGAHGTMYSALAGILSEVKSVDPLAEAEDHYRDAYRYLNPEDSYDVTEKKLKNMMPAMASIEALFGVLKPYHEISDSDIAPPKEVLQLKEQLNAAYTRIVELGKEVDRAAQAQQTVKILPKHEDAFDELNQLRKELMEGIGANKQSVYVKILLDRSVRILEKTLLSGLDETELTEKERNFLTLAWNSSGALGNLAKDALLDQTHQKIIQEYSFEILEFLESKGYSPANS